MGEGRWRGGIKQFGGSLIDAGAQTQTAIVIQMKQNRGKQINPRLISPLWPVSVWECVCVSTLCVCLWVHVAAPLSAGNRKKSLVSRQLVPYSPLLSAVPSSHATHTHTHRQVLVMSYSFILAGIMQVNAVISNGAAASSLWACLCRLDCSICSFPHRWIT